MTSVKSSMPFELYNGQDNFKKLKCLFYGPSGVGKTVLAGSIALMPDLGPVIGGDIEGGMTSLVAAGYADGIDLTRIDSFTATDRSYMKLHKHLVGPNNYLS